MKKYLSEHTYYFVTFVVLSLYYNAYGYATLGTNDDWALRSLLAVKGVYGTLVMSYPLSYVMSHLYDDFPLVQWYSLLLSSVLLLNYYFIAWYIQKVDSFTQKVILFILALLFMSYIWFNMTITIVTLLTTLSALGFAKKNLYYSFALLFLASLLRTEMVLIFFPFVLVAFFMLRDNLTLRKGEFYAFIALILLILLNLNIQKLDKDYTDWLLFNKARASVQDMGILDKKNILSQQERVFLSGGWVQDDVLLPTSKVVDAAPSMVDMGKERLLSYNLSKFTHYHFNYWVYLLLLFSLIVIAINFKNKKALLLLVFVLGVFALIIMRDVGRVTIPLFIMWAFLLSESLEKNKLLNTMLLLIFTSIFAYYFYPQIGYRYHKENTLLVKEAKKLMHDNAIACEPSMGFPTNFSQEVVNIFQLNYLFHENDWLKIDKQEILPTGWLSRHPYFYIVHDLGNSGTKRKYANYHEFMIDDKTGYIGGKGLTSSDASRILLNTYDALYLKNKPQCKHETYIVAESKNFAISQIRVDCNSSDDQ